MADGAAVLPVPPHLQRARRAWAALGRTTPLAVDRAEVWTVELPFRRPLATAVGVHTARPLVLVHLVCRGPDGPVDGWGECAALGDTTYDAEDAVGAARSLATVLVPLLLAGAGETLPPPSELVPGPSGGTVGPLAFAALEQAVADAHLRAADLSLAGLLGVTGTWVPVGAVVGTVPDPRELVVAVDELVGAGYGRVKMKIGPGRDVDHVGAVRAAHPHLVLQADANGAYAGTGAGSGAGKGAGKGAGNGAGTDGEDLDAIDGFGLACLEQPLGRDDLAGHARLARRLATPVCLDESLDGPARVTEALDAGACGVICLKPARLGGVGAALEAMAVAAVRGVPVWAGGMFEAGYGRSVLATMAALAPPVPFPPAGPGTGPPGAAGAPGEDRLWPGDLAAPSTYLGDDVAPALDVLPDPRTGHLAVVIPDRPPAGLAAPPDPVLVERRAVRRVAVTR